MARTGSDGARAPATARPAPDGRPSGQAARHGLPPAGHIAGVVAGHALGVYDFVVFSLFSPQIGRAFFPASGAHASLLLALATFGVGFLMRPAGAAVMGRYADRHGRKPALLLAFGLMGFAVTGLAVMPGYASIGVWAQAAVVCLRLVQGFALGGEIGPVTAWLTEAAPAGRAGLLVSCQYAAQDLAVLAAGCLGVALAVTLSAPQMEVWGWRLAFLAGAAIVPVGLALRALLPEPGQGTVCPPPSSTLATKRAIGIGFVLLASTSVASYSLVYLTAFAEEMLALPAQLAFATTAMVGLSSLIADPVSGWLGDRLGRRRVMLWAWGSLLALTLPSFALLVYRPSVPVVLGAALLLAALISLGSNAALAWIAEAIPPAIRSQSVGMVYALAVAVFGGSTQVLATWLIGLTGTRLAPGILMSGAVFAGLSAMLAIPPVIAGARPGERD